MAAVGQPPAKSPSHSAFRTAANLANLLPTGVVFTFQTLTPSFSNNGSCLISNKCLMAALIVVSSIICFVSSFTDSFMDSEGKLWYGIATFRGLYVFNGGNMHNDLSMYRIRGMDFVRAFVSLAVYLAFALSESDVLECFFDHGGDNLRVLAVNLPMAAGVFAGFFFSIFHTSRRGLGTDVGHGVQTPIGARDTGTTFTRSDVKL